MAKFESPYASLIMQDESGVWAKFEAGVFETDDKDVIKRLRAAPDYATEVPDESAPVKRAPSRRSASTSSD